MKTSTLFTRGALAIAASALLIASAGCTSTQTPASPGPHQHVASDHKEMTVTSPGPHQ